MESKLKTPPCLSSEQIHYVNQENKESVGQTGGEIIELERILKCGKKQNLSISYIAILGLKRKG